MSKISRDVDEIVSFLATWNASHPDFENAEIKAKVKSSYKQFHAILVWGMIADEPGFGNDAQRQYTTEAISDLSHSYLLNLLSLYKVCRYSMRSGIENFIRVIILYAGTDVDALTSVYDLFSVAKDKYKSDATAAALISKLHSGYGELCKSVHSAKVDYLSLAVPFEKLSIFDIGQFKENNEKIRDVLSSINQLLFWLWTDRLASAGHENEDYVRDSVPRSLKRSKTA